MKKNKRRLHPLERASQKASFDMLGYIQQKFKEALIKRVKNNTQNTYNKLYME